jgi:hypothetical protein
LPERTIREAKVMEFGPVTIPVLLGSSYTRGGRSTRARRTERATPPVEFLFPMGFRPRP